MDEIKYINRRTGKLEKELVYGQSILKFLYGSSFLNRSLGVLLKKTLSNSSLFSRIYGYLQKRSASKKKIAPFIHKFKVDESEFLDSADSYQSFNDFFIRKLKPSARPIDINEESIVAPADARCLFYQNITKADGFVVKGKKFTLKDLIDDASLASHYENGSMIIARLCPSDYHRFHFPCDAFAGQTQLINGPLYSVNPIAIKKNLEIFSQNKRTKCLLQTKHIGAVLYMEIGATNVGSIHQTYMPNSLVRKGDEKGYFSFGGSSLIVLFEKERVQFDKDLLEASHHHVEVLCRMGEAIGHII